MGSITWLKWPDTNLLMREDFPTPGSPTTLTRHTDWDGPVSNIVYLVWNYNAPSVILCTKQSWLNISRVVHCVCVAITVLVLRFLLSHINHLISNWAQRNLERWHSIRHKVTAHVKGMIHMMTLENGKQSIVFFLVTRQYRPPVAWERGRCWLWNNQSSTDGRDWTSLAWGWRKPHCHWLRSGSASWETGFWSKSPNYVKCFSVKGRWEK